MIETIVQVQSQRYPFDQHCKAGQTIRVQDTQVFRSQVELNEKKNEMLKKNKLIDSPFIIRLLKIYQEELSLHYIYEHIPYSLLNYIHKFFKHGKQNILQMSSKLFLKKITYELAILISQLIDHRIEIDLAIDNLGITADQKLKVFMNSRCKMGHKTELSLIAFYSNRKDNILSHIEYELQKVRESTDKPQNFVIKGNKLIFPESQLNESIYTETIEHTQSANTSYFYDSCSFENSLKQSTNSCFENVKPQSKFDVRNTSHNIGSHLRNKSARQPIFSVDKGTKSHKNSFNFGASKAPKYRLQDYEDDKDDAKSFTHSRSVRIQLEQKLDGNKEKNRKDSYKVKITTFHEYQMDDCDPQDLFGHIPKNEEDIADFFSKHSPSKSQRFSRTQPKDQELYFEELHTPTAPKSKAAFVRKESMPQNGYRQSTATTARTLEQKVKLAKQKAESVLSRYLTSKKKSTSFNYVLDPQ